MNRNQRRASNAGGSGPVALAKANALVGQAVPLHQAGRLTEAEALYRQALALQPRHPDALHLLGMIACQTGRFTEAADRIGQAVAANRTVPDYHANLAYALHALGRVGEAEAAARAALRLRAPFPEAANTLGNALTAQGRFDEAAVAYTDALRARPDYADAMGNLGAVLQRLNRPTEAEPLLRQVLVWFPHRSDARTALGLALLDLDRVEEGEAALRTALELRPDNGGAALALALAVQRRGGRADALHRRSAILTPGEAVGWNGWGLSLHAQDRLAGAVNAFHRALRLVPDLTEAWTNLGNTHRLQGRTREAMAAQQRALALRPDYAAAHSNLGQSHQDYGNDREAESGFSRALLCDPGESTARFNRALLRLRLGRMTAGWADYADRFTSGRLGALPARSMPEWQGQDLPRGRLLVWGEQGLGDELMFGSILPDLVGSGRIGQVVIECDPRLVGLVQRSIPTAVVRAALTGPVEADAHLPFGSLPRLLRARLADFPARNGWLRPDPAEAALWRTRLDALGPGLRVGIAWTSRRVTASRRTAYTTLAQWEAVLRLPNLHLVSLQYDKREDEIAEVERRFGVTIHRWPDLDQTADLERTAALIAGLDLVLTVASSPGELAGALGIPVWRIGGPDWTHLGTGTRPWFPSMRSLAPKTGSDLSTAIEQAKQDLVRLSGDYL
ncbi:tetratricopeptide repeat protein [Azospirillum griseum]|uniref:Tetratricopeptide repeat protein n=1 Tax=Azospirillum griseum TaxID=2496639 RepID=A0A431VK75_9PROT|nr:tetratricopeptide repeat protein [Azospirillum griseum]RTR22409.1 tetratricopeptide repeat protein [Azospirillum griseum]